MLKKQLIIILFSTKIKYIAFILAAKKEIQL